MTTNRIFGSSALTSFAAGLFALAATFATVSTVRAEEFGVADFRNHVEDSIDKTLRLPEAIDEDHRGVATVAVIVDANGKVRTADLIRSSGFGAFDQEALRTARAVSYPETGKPRTVAMVLGINRPVGAKARREGQRLVTAWRAGQCVMLANDTAAQQPDS